MVYVNLNIKDADSIKDVIISKVFWFSNTLTV